MVLETRFATASWMIITLAVVFSGCAPSKPADSEPTVVAKGGFGSATVIGKVAFEGTPPATKPVTPADATNDQACIAMHGDKKIADESFLQNPDRTLKNVFVFVEGVTGTYAPPKEAAVLGQNGCLFRPRVFGVLVGQKLSIRNEDPTFHNVKTITRNNPPINLAQAIGRTDETTFAKPEMMVEMRCDVHPWMHAYCAVMTHPFFSVTGDNGAFKIERLPAGSYKLIAWHETLGKLSQELTVKEGETAELSFLFKN